MKNNIKKYFNIQVIGWILIVLIGVAFYFAILRWDTFTAKMTSFLNPFQPFLIGFVLAYLLKGIVNWCEDKPLKSIKNHKVQRSISILFAMIFFFAIISALFMMVVPQLMESLIGLVNNFTTYSQEITNKILDIIYGFDVDTIYIEQIEAWFDSLEDTVYAIINSSLPILLSWITTFFSSLTTSIVAIFITIYFLASKETLLAQLKKVLAANLEEKTVNKMTAISDMTNKTFSKFISGKLLDSLIIGIFCFIGMTIFKFDYAVLISTIIGVTNIIPYFGPFIGAIPCVIFLILIDPMQAVWFAVFIIGLQQIDGNIIGPKILGDATGLPLIWVMFAILVGGGTFGFVGMLLGVPTFAVIYNLVKANTESKLAQKDMPTDTESYIK